MGKVRDKGERGIVGVSQQDAWHSHDLEGMRSESTQNVFYTTWHLVHPAPIHHLESFQKYEYKFGNYIITKIHV